MPLREAFADDDAEMPAICAAHIRAVRLQETLYGDEFIVEIVSVNRGFLWRKRVRST